MDVFEGGEMDVFKGRQKPSPTLPLNETRFVVNNLFYFQSLISSIGVGLGWICVYHQPGATTCIRSTADGTIF